VLVLPVVVRDQVVGHRCGVHHFVVLGHLVAGDRRVDLGAGVELLRLGLGLGDPSVLGVAFLATLRPYRSKP
jgi:hypothetical protein